MCMTIVLVGNGLIDVLNQVFEQISLTPTETINSANYGNFRTLTLLIDINEYEVLSKRKQLLECLEKAAMLTILFPHGDPLSLYIFKNFPRQKHIL